jgi:hypothetical protein
LNLTRARATRPAWSLTQFKISESQTRNWTKEKRPYRT